MKEGGEEKNGANEAGSSSVSQRREKEKNVLFCSLILSSSRRVDPGLNVSLVLFWLLILFAEIFGRL